MAYQPHTPPNTAGWLAAIGSTAAFSISAPLATAVFRTGLDPTSTMGLRLAITTGLLFATLALVAPERLRMDARGLAYTLLAGVFTGLSTLLFFWSLTRMDTSIAAMLFSIFPLAVLLLLALRGEKFTYRNAVRLALAVVGGYLLVGGQGQANWVGVLMVLGAVVFSALQTVIIQWHLQAYDGLTVTAYMVAAMALVVAGWWVAEGAVWTPPSGAAWAAIVVMSVISTYLARLAMFAAMRQLGSGQMALLVPLETLLTVVWSVLFLSEWLTLAQGIGSGLILLSTLLAVRRLGRVVRWRPRWRTWWRV